MAAASQLRLQDWGDSQGDEGPGTNARCECVCVGGGAAAKKMEKDRA